MERKICAYRHYFTEFIGSIKEVEAKKVFYVLDMLKMQERLSERFVKHVVISLALQWIPKENAKDAEERG